jgi:hypothetical protein
MKGTITFTEDYFGEERELSVEFDFTRHSEPLDEGMCYCHYHLVRKDDETDAGVDGGRDFVTLLSFVKHLGTDMVIVPVRNPRRMQ